MEPLRSAAWIGLAAVTGVLMGGCIAPHPIAEVAALEQADLPIVHRMSFEDGNFLDPTRVDLWLIEGATGEDARDLWCQTLLPFGLSPDYTMVWPRDERDGSWPVPPDCDEGGPVPTLRPLPT